MEEEPAVRVCQHGVEVNRKMLVGVVFTRSCHAEGQNLHGLSGKRLWGLPGERC